MDFIKSKKMKLTSGLCWFCYQGDRIVLLGAMRKRRMMSSLHLKMEAMLWAMMSILDNNVACHKFETYCSDLFSITQSSEEWPALAILTDRFTELLAQFQYFFLSLISRSLNLKADCLTSSTRYRFLEFYFVNNSHPL